MIRTRNPEESCTRLVKEGSFKHLETFHLIYLIL